MKKRDDQLDPIGNKQPSILKRIFRILLFIGGILLLYSMTKELILQKGIITKEDFSKKLIYLAILYCIFCAFSIYYMYVGQKIQNLMVNGVKADAKIISYKQSRIYTTLMAYITYEYCDTAGKKYTKEISLPVYNYKKFCDLGYITDDKTKVFYDLSNPEKNLPIFTIYHYTY